MKKQSIIDIAIRDIILIYSDATIKDAIETITEKKIRNLIVYDASKEIYSVLSVKDIVSIAKESAKLAKSVSTLNLRHLVTCSKHTSTLEAVMLFGDDNSILGIVEDNGALSAIATYSNVLNAIYGYEDDSFSQPIKSLLAKESVLIAQTGECLAEYLDILNTTSADCLMVSNNETPKGIITKRDIVKMLAKNVNLNQNVEILMSYPLMTVDSKISINNALSYMRDNQLKRVIVVNKDGKLEGVITQKNLLDAIYTKLTQKGFFNLNKINSILQEQVNIKTMELQHLNKELEGRVEAATKELRKSERNLAEMKRNEALFELIKNISHHWRQPLNIISLLAQESEMILSEEGRQATVVSNLRSIAMEAKALSSTIDKMRTMYKKDETYGECSANLVKAAEYAVGLFSGEHRIQILKSYDIDDALPLHIPDSSMQFILKELVGNSIAIAAKNGYGNLSLHFSLKNSGKENIIGIQDDAGGINEDDIDLIFDPYFTTEFKSRDKGLGLFLVKNLVEKSLNGKINVHTVEGGARFEIKLPA